MTWKRASPSDLKWEEKAEQLEFDALTRVRSTAEKWAAGQGAIVGLAATILLVKGREDIGELTTGYQRLVALTLAVALVVGLIAAYVTALAAQGTPENVAWPSGQRLRTWERDQALKSKRLLKTSRVLTVVTVLLLALAVALTWFGDAKEDGAAPSVVVIRPADAAVCGKLAAGRDGALVVMPEEGDAVPLTGTDVSSVAVVAECP